MNIISISNREEILNKIDSKYTLQEVFDLLKELEFGKEQEWLDNIINLSIDILGENNEYINKLNMLRCVILINPRSFHLSIHTMIFMIQILIDIGLKSVKDFNFEGDLKIMYSRILTTVMTASISITFENIMSSCSGEWKIPEPTTEQLNSNKHKVLDFGAWDEFMEYIENETEILSIKDFNNI